MRCPKCKVNQYDSILNTENDRRNVVTKDPFKELFEKLEIEYPKDYYFKTIQVYNNREWSYFIKATNRKEPDKTFTVQVYF